MSIGQDCREFVPLWADIGWPVKKALHCGCPERHVHACGRPLDLFRHGPWASAYGTAAEALASGRNIVSLLGTPGTGKTQIAVSIMLRCIQRDGSGLVAVYTTARDMFDKVRTQFDAGGSDQRPRYRVARVLVVDELDKCQWSEWERQEFIALIDKRYVREGGATILVSNWTPAEMEKRCGSSVVSRLAEVGTTIEMSGWTFRGCE